MKSSNGRFGRKLGRIIPEGVFVIIRRFFRKAIFLRF
ncbi:unnamed protein product [Linum tenue]|uniref:Uncharacterized protein n=1 Tax=Linum tenue TaxID=586396 RepID=A0AAV0N4J2_9ROSI|nr:unnamed protein product [Linum tenue]